MAKGITPTKTRLAATVNARYYPVEGVADAYCLDGKLPGRRETRSVNMTIDRVSRGFLIAVYGYPVDGRAKTEAGTQALIELSHEMSGGDETIDNAINDLAEAALDVTGRLEVRQEGVREPYFAGVMVRDGEIAALTVGNGIALIYRRDALYPLTSSARDLKATDLYGDPIDGIDDFIAGDAGTISYSNIAQLEEGDRFILCNDDLFQSIGQDGILRIMSESEDQMDVSSEMITYAAASMPGKPLQVIALAVEKIEAEEAPNERFSLGRFATQAMEPVRQSHEERPKPEPAAPPAASVPRYQKQDHLDDPGHEQETYPDEAPQDLPYDGDYPEAGAGAGEVTSSPDDAETAASLPRRDVTPFHGVDGHTHEMTSPFDDLSLDSLDQTSDQTSSEAPDSEPDTGTYRDDYGVSGTTGELPKFAYTPEHQRRRSRFQDRRADDYQNDYGVVPDRSRRSASASDRDYDDYNDYDEGDDYDDIYADDQASLDRRRRRPNSRTRRMIFYAILLAVIAICIFALVKLLTKDDKPQESQPSVSVTEPGGVITPPTEPEETLPEPSESETAAPSETDEPTPSAAQGEVSYVVVAGDSWWTIATKHYNGASEALCQKLAEYNGKNMTDNIHVGDVIKVPPLTVLIGGGE